MDASHGLVRLAPGQKAGSSGRTPMAGEILAFLHRHNRTTLLLVVAAVVWVGLAV